VTLKEPASFDFGVADFKTYLPGLSRRVQVARP
jgi:hypothetical protein